MILIFLISGQSSIQLSRCGRLPLSFSTSFKCSGITEALSAHHLSVQCCIRGLHADNSTMEKNNARGCVSVGILPQGAGKENEIQTNKPRMKA